MVSNLNGIKLYNLEYQNDNVSCINVSCRLYLVLDTLSTNKLFNDRQATFYIKLNMRGLVKALKEISQSLYQLDNCCHNIMLNMPNLRSRICCRLLLLRNISFSGAS